MSRASVVLKVLFSQTWMLLQSAAKGWNSLGYWHMNLWAAELGKYYSNVYGKISFASLNILSSVVYDALRFHLLQNNGSVYLHSEYPNWTVAHSRDK